MAFLNLNLVFRSSTDLRAWLRAQPQPQGWRPTGATFHNTYIPNEAQWMGRASMLSMQQAYEAKTPVAWDRGPHVYVAVGTRDNGYWIMTPPQYEGIHAGPCNSSRFGFEIVGDFNARPMTEAQLDWAAQGIAAYHEYAGLRRVNLAAHRDCMPGTLCPGNVGYTQKAALAARVQHYLDAWSAPQPAPSDDGLPTPLRYLGVSKNDQAISAGTFAAVLHDHDSPLAPFAAALFDWLISLDIAADVWLAHTHVESDFGKDDLARRLCNPLNIKQRGDYPGQQTFADYLGAPWLGALWSMAHLKLMHGQQGRFTVEQIAPVWVYGPAGGDASVYVQKLRATVAAIRQREVA